MEEVSPKNADAVLSDTVPLVLDNIRRNKRGQHLASGTKKVDDLADRLRMLSTLKLSLKISRQIGPKMSSLEGKKYFLEDVESALQSYSYLVLTEGDGSTLITLRLRQVVESLSEETFSKLLKEYESAILQAVKEHQPEVECAINVCPICKNKASVERIISTNCNPEKNPIEEGADIVTMAIPESRDNDTGGENSSSNSDEVDGKSLISTSASADDEYEKLNSELERCWKESKKYRRSNREKISQEIRKDANITCILFYNKAADKMWHHKNFNDKQSALQWIYQPENRAILGETFINFGVSETRTTGSDVDITDFKISDVEIIDPTTGNVLVKEKAAPDTGSGVATFAFDPEKFKPLIKSLMAINGEVKPIVYGRLRIDGEELNKIYEIELENDPEEQSEEEKWNAFGVVHLQALSERTRNAIMEKVARVLTDARKHRP